MDLTYKILILIVLFLVYGCRRYQPETEYAIRQSGEYGSEYVSLLDSYFREDSLCYNSAVFLLNNMPYHMSDSIISEYDDEYYDNFMACLFATFDPTSHPIPKPDCDISSIETILKPNGYPDIRIIRPSFIKDNIDASMDLWRNSPYSKSIGWDEFVNYLLPYRAFNEPVHYSKSMLNDIFKKHLITDGEPNNTADIILRYKKLARYSRDVLKGHRHVNNNTYSCFLPTKKYDCNSFATATCNILRSIGIPTILTIIPQWNDIDMGHTCCVSIDTAGNRLIYSPPYIDFETDLIRIKYATKLYAVNYAVNPDHPCCKGFNPDLIPRSIRSPYLKDVTGSMLETATVSIMSDSSMTDSICFIAAFNKVKENNINPVGWGYLDGTTNAYTFDNVPLNQLFFPARYDERQKKYIQCLEPFIVRNNGNAHCLEHPFSQKASARQKITLTRKYPIKWSTQYNLKNLSDAFLLGSNNPDMQFDTIARLPSHLVPYLQYVPIRNTMPYRIYKLSINDSDPLYLSEIKFINTSATGDLSYIKLPQLSPEDNLAGGMSCCIISGSLIDADGTTDLAFDNNDETVCESPYVIMDAHTPKVVDGLLLLPKNSDNGITEGNQYALYYYQNGVWKLHGRKTARYNYIEFDDVPSNTLYWLRNETTGVEELPFFYKYDEQVFINSL